MDGALRARYRHRGYWPYAGLAIGALAAWPYYGYYPYYDGGYVDEGYVEPGYGGDVAYSMQRFRSYNPATGTYRGYDGLNHACP